jgi:hypothetical protein
MSELGSKADFSKKDVPYKRIRFAPDCELSELAEQGIRYYEDCSVGFRIEGERKVDISLKLGLAHDDLPIRRGHVWQPEIYRGLRSWDPNYRQPSHGFRLNPQIIQGLRAGSRQDIFDYAVAPAGSKLGLSVEINGEAFDLAASHEKPLSSPQFRPTPVKSEYPPKSLIERKGPRKRNIEKFFTRSGLMVTASYRDLPYGFELTQDEDTLVYQQLPHRFRRLSSPEGDRGIVRLASRFERKGRKSGPAEKEQLEVITGATQLIDVVVFEAIEDLIPYQVEKIRGYKSPQEYFEAFATENGRCPVSGHTLNPNATEADFGAIIRAKNRLVVRPEEFLPVVQFRLAVIGTNQQAGLKPYGIEVESCPKCFPTRCYGAHESKTEATICPDCGQSWDEGHICLSNISNVLDEYFQPGGFSEDLEETNDISNHPHYQIIEKFRKD